MSQASTTDHTQMPAAKQTYGEPWRSLIEQAENWRHSQTMASDQEVKEFIAFTARELGTADA